MPHFLVASDKCKGSLSAFEICSLAETVLLGRFPDSKITKAPLSDGGEGFTEILTRSASGVLHSLKVLDSIGNEKKVHLGICDIENLNSSVVQSINLPPVGNLAIVEMAEAAGLADVPINKRNPWETSSFGVGQMLKASAELDVDAILLGIGGSSTNDIGIGALSALGLSLRTKNEKDITFPVPARWKNVSMIYSEELIELPPIKIACDVNNLLFGEYGATAQYGLQKGLPEDQVGQFENEIKNLLQLMKAQQPKIKELSQLNGSGAAGGIGFGLSLFYNVSLVPGFKLISSWLEIEKKIEEADFVITGEGKFDKTSLQGKGPFEILRISNLKNTPSLIVAGFVEPCAAKKITENFKDCDLISFGRNDWSLEKNLSYASRTFCSTLKRYKFPHLPE